MEVVELRQEIKKLREELEQNDVDMKKMERQITDSESRRMEIVKKQIGRGLFYFLLENLWIF